jgi:hypothetical protein
MDSHHIRSQGLVHDLGEMGDVDVQLLPPGSPDLRPQLRVAPHKSTFLTRTPSTKLRAAYPFLQVASPRASIHPSSDSGSPIFLSSAAAARPPSDSFTPLFGAPPSDSVTAARCISSPALLPINLDEMEKKIEQHTKEWAQLKQVQQCATSAPAPVSNSDETGGGAERTKDDGSGKRTQHESDEKKERKAKSGKVRRTLRRRAKGKEAEDLPPPSATTKAKKQKKKEQRKSGEKEETKPRREPLLSFSVDSANNRRGGGELPKADDPVEAAAEAEVDRRQIRRKATIGDWERADAISPKSDRKPRYHIISLALLFLGLF